MRDFKCGVEMREVPIIMSSWSIGRILDGDKVETRRLVKPQPGCPPTGIRDGAIVCGHGMTTRLPWQRGDHLWVREAHRYRHEVDCYQDHGPFYCDRHQFACDCDEPEWLAIDRRSVRYEQNLRIGRELRHDSGGEVVNVTYLSESSAIEHDSRLAHYKKRPAFHLPKWAARIWLEVAYVRVERLWDIDDKGCRLEGCTGTDPEPADEGGTIYAWEGRSSAACPRAHFSALWDRMHAAKGLGWNANPWVTVTRFRRLARHERSARDLLRRREAAMASDLRAEPPMTKERSDVADLERELRRRLRGAGL